MERVGPPSPCFWQEYDSMGLSKWGSAKNMIPNGLVAQEAAALSCGMLVNDE